jgi:plasmid stabilization system protein ParE
MSAIERCFALLADRPGIGHARSDLTDAAVKFWSVYSYLVVYDPAAQPIEIVRVVHARRDVRKLLS